jgi:hypothetical protein
VVELLVALGRGAEAIPRIDALVAVADQAVAAGKHLDPRLVPEMFSRRAHIQLKAEDAAGCRATAEMWEKRKPRNPDELYNAACFRAAAAAVQAKTPVTDAARLAEEDASRAIAWLRQAVAADYKDSAHMEEDTELDCLRGRADFQQMLAELKASKN